MVPATAFAPFRRGAFFLAVLGVAIASIGAWGQTVSALLDVLSAGSPAVRRREYRSRRSA